MKVAKEMFHQIELTYNNCFTLTLPLIQLVNKYIVYRFKRFTRMFSKVIKLNENNLYNNNNNLNKNVQTTHIE